MTTTRERDEDDKLRDLLQSIADTEPTAIRKHTIYHCQVDPMIEFANRSAEYELRNYLVKRLRDAGEPLDGDFSDRLRRFIEARVAWYDLPRRD